MKRSNFVVALCAAFGLMFLAQPIFAQKAFLEQWKTIYPGAPDALEKCTTCHALTGADKPKKTNLNAYGKDLQSSDEAKVAMGGDHKGKYTPDELKAVAAGIKAIGSKQSNGNGHTNDDNIKAGVNPGMTK